MNFFRRKKKTENVQKSQDEHLINELCGILKTHGDAILRGKTKLTLTTPILVALNGYFHKITEGVNEACFQVANHGEDTNKLQSILFIFDFIQKVLSLKLTSGTIATVCPLLTLEYFKALQVLEISRVNILSIKGLHLIRRQIKSLKCFHATFSINDVVLAFGRNLEDHQTMPMLETLDISYNQVKSLNDDALKLIPALMFLDASYNAIENADSETLPAIYNINLGYNMIFRIPVFAISVCNSLTILNLRNNNLSSLDGLEYFCSLVNLDVTANCIVDFKDFSQLAALENLCIVRMHDNPVCFNPGYRLCVIRSMSPVKRTAKVFIDGIELNSAELCHLGANVQPVALTSYLNDRPLSFSTSSPHDLTDDVSISSPVLKSTPRERRKVRNAVIGDASNATSENGSLPSILIRSSGSLMTTSPAPFSDTNSVHSLSSDMNSVGQSQRLDYDSWAVEEELRSELASNGSIEDSSELLSPHHQSPSLRSCSTSNSNSNGVYQAGAMTLSTVVKQINDGGGGRGSVLSMHSDEYVNQESDDGISVVTTDGEMEYAYLVESISKKSKDDGFGSVDVENIFIIFRSPYLIEKSDDGKTKFKLDMNYLRGLELGLKDIENEMTVSLHFDLIREDCRYRQYRFPEQEQYDSFITAIQPIYAKNHQRKLAEMKYCECLKCGMVFLNRQISEEYYECPNVDCGSRMVIEKTTNEVDVIDSDEEDNENNNNDTCDTCSDDLERTVQDDSSIAIVIPSFNDSTRMAQGISSWPEYCQANLKLNSVAYQQSKSLPFYESCRNGVNSGNYVAEAEHHNRKMHRMSTSHNRNLSHDPFIFSAYKKHSGCKSYSNSPGSCTSSSRSRGHSRQASKGSIKKLPRSAMHTPVISNQESLFSNMDDFGKCNHRLKLYLDINFFAKLNEEFLCQIRCDCTGYEKSTIYDSILVITDKTVYIFVITDSTSDTPEGCIKRLAFCPIAQLRYFQCGYFSQSFIIDSVKPGFRYKFLVGNSNVCNEFLYYVEGIIHSHLAYTEVISSIVREVNPQTHGDIRNQVFNAHEPIEAKVKRLLTQITDYSYPPLLKTKKMRIRSHQQCFVAKEFIDWLFSRKEADTRKHALDIGQELLDGGLIYSISKDQIFKDDEGIYKFSPNPTKVQVNGSNTDTLSIDTMSSDDGEMDLKVLVYQLVKSRILEQDTVSSSSTVILTNSHIFLVDENHQWPLSKLLPPPSPLQQHFQVKDVNKIINITSMEFYVDAPQYVKITLVKEEVSDDETSWLVQANSTEELKKLTDGISKIWEDLFAIELTVLLQPTIMPVLESYVLV